MDNVAFLVDITSHLNVLNMKLQGKNNSICELITAVRSFQRKLELFSEDLQGDCAHFPAVQDQVQGQRDVSAFVDFVDKLIVNFSKRFDSFSFGQQLTIYFHPQPISNHRCQRVLKGSHTAIQVGSCCTPSNGTDRSPGRCCPERAV